MWLYYILEIIIIIKSNFGNSFNGEYREYRVIKKKFFEIF